MEAATISALVIGIGALISAVGLCVRRLHLRHLKAKSCCGEMEVDMASTPHTSLDIKPADVPKV